MTSTLDLTQLVEDNGGFLEVELAELLGFDQDDPEIVWVPDHGIPYCLLNENQTEVNPLAARMNRLLSAEGWYSSDWQRLVKAWLLPSGYDTVTPLGLLQGGHAARLEALIIDIIRDFD